MGTQRFRIHGLIVESQIALPAALFGGAAEPDLEIRVGEFVSKAPLESAVLASREEPIRFRIWRTDDGYVVDSAPAAFKIDLALRHIVAQPKGCPTEALALHLLGPALTAVVMLRGGTVLHASAVRSELGATLLAGPSGSGKSTLCALLCGAGSAMLADDAARVEPRRAGWIVHRAAIELRLRDDVAELASCFPDRRVRKSGDGRVALACPAPDVYDEAPLRQVLFTHFDRDAPTLGIRRLTPRDASIAILRNLRIGSWCSPDILRQQTRIATDLARTTEAFDVTVPPTAPGVSLPSSFRELVLGPGTRDRP